MPRPSFPPTPAPSTDITGKTAQSTPQFDSSFALPPAAIANSSRGSTSSEAASNASDSSYRPPSPASPVATTKTTHSRKRSSATANASANAQSAQQAVVTKDDYSLPPPPTRSRKIIQMKPKESQGQPKSQPAAATATTNAKGAATGGKKKQAGNTTAAGRKIARKTAHSLIERRRRSKMNEEFGVLKDMIPACAGQEMHKLAILQASIEYMRYLEQCIADLKSVHQSRLDSPASAPERTPPTVNATIPEEDEEEDEEDEDEEMSDAVSPTHLVNAVPQKQQTYQFANASPAIYPSDRSVYSTTTSPAILPGDRNYSSTISPALHPSDPHHYSITSSSIRSTATSPSIQASPAFAGQTPSQSHFSNPFPSGSSEPKGSLSGAAGVPFALTSPALGPQADREDHEATEALLMLNTDRRSWSGARGMSVKDLLSG